MSLNILSFSDSKEDIKQLVNNDIKLLVNNEKTVQVATIAIVHRSTLHKKFLLHD